MFWRLIGLILILGILLSFIAFNLNNTCDISFGFARFSGVPVYFTVFASFILGMFCSLPFIIIHGARKKTGKSFLPKKKKDGQLSGTGGDLPYGID
ncbi:MAG: hypothetical protein LBD31_07430 [Treponema sp.]|jgi:uncharacterized integral membrane protein|nr:hypothetical protein [Treponema sp.]